MKYRLVKNYEDIPEGYGKRSSHATMQAAQKAAREYISDGYNVIINKNDLFGFRHTGKPLWHVYVENW